jgi:hypothetical protein
MLIFCSGETWTRVSQPTHAATTGAAVATKTPSVCPR